MLNFAISEKSSNFALAFLFRGSVIFIFYLIIVPTSAENMSYAEVQPIVQIQFIKL